MRVAIAPLASVLGLILGLLGISARTADAADTAVSVLGIEASEGAPDTLAAALTDALRQRVSATKGFRLVPGRDLVEVKLVFSCPDEAPSCMAQAGKSLGAGKLIFGGVKQSVGDNFVVTLKLLDTARGSVDAWVAEQIGRAQATGPGVRAPVQKWFSSLTGMGAVGLVRVRADVTGAQVALDGNAAGTTGADDLVVPGVAPGKHEITVTKAGYEPVRRQVNVPPGETTELDVRMSRITPVAGPPPPPVTSTASPAPDDPPPRQAETSVATKDVGDGKTVLRAATWGTLVAGLAGVGLGIYYGVEVQSINNDLDSLRRFPCARPSGLCDITGKEAKGLSPAEKKYVTDQKAEGDRLSTFQWIAYGTGGALLVAGGYLFYRAYLRVPPADAPTGAAGPRLAWTPIVGPNGVGFAAALRF